MIDCACDCGPRPGEAALPPSQVWVRLNSIEPATLSMLIPPIRWPWVCRGRHASVPVNKNARATASRFVFCRLDHVPTHLIRHLTGRFLSISNGFSGMVIWVCKISTTPDFVISRFFELMMLTLCIFPALSNPLRAFQYTRTPYTDLLRNMSHTYICQMLAEDELGSINKYFILMTETTWYFASHTYFWAGILSMTQNSLKWIIFERSMHNEFSFS